MRVLLLDQDRRTERTLEPLLAREELTAASSQADGLRFAASGQWDLILLDQDFGGAGIELLGRFRRDAIAPVVLLAERPSLELTLEAMERGARDVLSKPASAERLREILGEARRQHRARAFADRAPEGKELVGSSAEMLTVFKAVARAARSDATVLVLGESGTGKEMVARVLHAQSHRNGGPFIAINCAAIPENLLESELFGHEKGAFTGAIGRRIGRLERASGGTLFLDEIGDMSIALQSKILRALQEREIERVGGGSVSIDVRVVAATNRDLLECVEEGSFREDLYYRLAVVSLRLPPLRQRGRDLDRLVEHYGAYYAREHGRPVRAISEEALGILRAHPWPGNVRQLRNALERAVVMADGEVLLPEHLPADIREPSRARPASTPEPHEPLCTLQEMERRMIGRALGETRGNCSAAAELLGIHRNTLRRKMQEYGLGNR